MNLCGAEDISVYFDTTNSDKFMRCVHSYAVEFLHPLRWLAEPLLYASGFEACGFGLGFRQRFRS